VRLADFPSGGSLFFDANCLLYHFLNTRPICTHTLHRAEIGDIRALTSVSVLGEVRHRLLVLEASGRFGLPPRKALTYLRRHPDAIRMLPAANEAVETLNALRVDVVPVTMKIFLASQRISDAFGLLTTDALIIATMRASRLVHLASNDTDFTRVPGITLWRP